jgi:hypothetical protein
MRTRLAQHVGSVAGHAYDDKASRFQDADDPFPDEWLILADDDSDEAVS